jgi:hypothetical protein
LGFPVLWKNRSPLEPVSRSTHILLLEGILNRICVPSEDKFSVAGSITSTEGVTPISSGVSIGLLEFLEGIALIGQGTVSTTLLLDLVFFTTCKSPVLSDPTLQ